MPSDVRPAIRPTWSSVKWPVSKSFHADSHYNAAVLLRHGVTVSSGDGARAGGIVTRSRYSEFRIRLVGVLAARRPGMAATTFMRSWQHFEFVTLVTLPMFLFSTTFYPLSVYPRPIQIIVECTPLYQGVALMRGLTLGAVGPALLWHVAYLAVMGVAGLYLASFRIGHLLLK